MTIPALMAGVLIGGIGSYILTMDEIRHRDEELIAARKVVAPLKGECPQATVKVATQVGNGDWNVRCVGRGKSVKM